MRQLLRSKSAANSALEWIQRVAELDRTLKPKGAQTFFSSDPAERGDRTRDRAQHLSCVLENNGIDVQIPNTEDPAQNCRLIRNRNDSKDKGSSIADDLSRGRPPAQALTSESSEHEHDAAQSIPTDAPITWTIVQNPNTLDVWIEWSKYLQACVTRHRTVHQTSLYDVLESLTQMTELASWVRYDRTTPSFQNTLEEMGGAVRNYSSTSRARIETSGSEKVQVG